MKRIVNFVLTAHFMVCCGLACVANPQFRQEMYQNEVCNKESGVYEINGDLYAHVRLPVTKRDSRSHLKLKAVVSANEMLKSWAIEYTKDCRQNCTMSTGWIAAMGVLDNLDSSWRFSDWSVRIAGQEFSGKTKDELWFGQVVSKEDLIRNIPPSFSCSNPEKDLMVRNLNRLKTRLHQVDVVDLFSDSVNRESAKNEWMKVETYIDNYFKNSSFVATLKERKKRIASPTLTERWVDDDFKSNCLNSFEIIGVTNFAYHAKTTNRIDRAQTEEERIGIGVAEGGVFHVDTYVSEKQEIIFRDSVITGAVQRIHRSKMTSVTSGTPRFEEIFLSEGKLEIAAGKATEFGRKAASVYYDNVSSFEKKESIVFDALCENPGDALLWNMFGNCRMKRGDTVGAVVCFRHALRLSGGEGFALPNLMQAYKKLGCDKLAICMAVLTLGSNTDKWSIDVAKSLLDGK